MKDLHAASSSGFRRVWLMVLPVLLTTVAAQGGSGGTTVVKAAELHIGSGEVVVGGMILIRDGLIVEVGGDLRVPEGATVLEFAEACVTPGLIDVNAAVEATDQMSVPDQDGGSTLQGLFGRMATSRLQGADPLDTRLSETDGPVDPDVVPELEDDEQPAFSEGTRVGVSLAEQSAEVIPDTFVIDSVNLRSPDFDRLLGGGVTTVFVAPDSAAVISSRGAVVRTGGPIDQRVLRERGAIKATMGTDPSRRGSFNRVPRRRTVSFLTRRPTTRMGVVWVFRKAFYDTRRYVRGLEVSGADTPSEAAMSVLAKVLTGDIPLRVQARAQFDIETALRLTKEFDLPFILEEATEAYRCIDMLKARRTPVIFGPIYDEAPGDRAFSFEVDRSRLHTFKTLVDAGIETALTAHEMRDEEGLVRQAMAARRSGVSLGDVMKAVTQTPAKLLGLDGQLGTLAKGKRADLVVWSGQPFGATSSLVVVMMDGEIVLDRRTK